MEEQEEKEESFSDILKRQLTFWESVLADPKAKVEKEYCKRTDHKDEYSICDDPAVCNWRSEGIARQAIERIDFLRKALK